MLVLLSKTLILNEKLSFIKQNIAFEWKSFVFIKQNITFERKSLVLLSKTLLFRETQENLQNTKKTKKTKKTKDSNRIQMVLGGGHGFLSEALVFLVFLVF